MPRAGRLHVGTSGWVYADWVGRFYDAGSPQRTWFGQYARRFDTVEVNGSFYRLPERSTFEAWREMAPKGFVYAVKFSRFGTHMKRLLDAPSTVSRFLDRAEGLGEKLGPVLVQLPPRFRANPERLDAFLSATSKAHRWAIEVRDPSWLCDEVYDVLHVHRAALVEHDLLPNHPRVRPASFSYYRFHGVDYGGNYDKRVLSAWARRCSEEVAEGRDVYAYFNNDKLACGVFDALYLASRVTEPALKRPRRALAS